MSASTALRANRAALKKRAEDRRQLEALRRQVELHNRLREREVERLKERRRIYLDLGSYAGTGGDLAAPPPPESHAGRLVRQLRAVFGRHFHRKES